eukprot:CAMPEP_0184551630 /NCGR_PEP_ID=MMETSP0199_2-20130426/25918_1 /TAXON_ID=1112570 /ORGANISM="Thraustochytrium sp., Strain LLF1b" /LENGTH=1048 /DNA_ID=CAMNT_0026946885 /DNA_START=83 /DNA_END=3226 /DNA_ORIENTATION=+
MKFFSKLKLKRKGTLAPNSNLAEANHNDEEESADVPPGTRFNLDTLQHEQNEENSNRQDLSLVPPPPPPPPPTAAPPAPPTPRSSPRRLSNSFREESMSSGPTSGSHAQKLSQRLAAAKLPSTHTYTEDLESEDGTLASQNTGLRVPDRVIMEKLNQFYSVFEPAKLETVDKIMDFVHAHGLERLDRGLLTKYECCTGLANIQGVPTIDSFTKEDQASAIGSSEPKAHVSVNDDSTQFQGATGSHAEIAHEEAEDQERQSKTSTLDSLDFSASPSQRNMASSGGVIYKSLESALNARRLESLLGELLREGVEDYVDLAKLDTVNFREQVWSNLDYMTKKKLQRLANEAKEVAPSQHSEDQTNLESPSRVQSIPSMGAAAFATAAVALLRKKSSETRSRATSDSSDASHAYRSSAEYSKPPPLPPRDDESELSSETGDSRFNSAATLGTIPPPPPSRGHESESSELSDSEFANEQEIKTQSPSISPPPPPPPPSRTGRQTVSPSSPSVSSRDTNKAIKRLEEDAFSEEAAEEDMFSHQSSVEARRSVSRLGSCSTQINEDAVSESESERRYTYSVETPEPTRGRPLSSQSRSNSGSEHSHAGASAACEDSEAVTQVESRETANLPSTAPAKQPRTQEQQHDHGCGKEEDNNRLNEIESDAFQENEGLGATGDSGSESDIESNFSSLDQKVESDERDLGHHSDESRLKQLDNNSTAEEGALLQNGGTFTLPGHLEEEEEVLGEDEEEFAEEGGHHDTRYTERLAALERQEAKARAEREALVASATGEKVNVSSTEEPPSCQPFHYTPPVGEHMLASEVGASKEMAAVLARRSNAIKEKQHQVLDSKRSNEEEQSRCSGPCNAFKLDLAAVAFNTCKCGFNKSEHSSEAFIGAPPKQPSMAPAFAPPSLQKKREIATKRMDETSSSTGPARRKKNVDQNGSQAQLDDARQTRNGTSLSQDTSEDTTSTTTLPGASVARSGAVAYVGKDKSAGAGAKTPISSNDAEATSAGTTPTPAIVKDQDSSFDVGAIREEVVQFYRLHNPDKLDTIDE